MNTANANNKPAHIAFFLLRVLVSIDERSKSITAKAQGLILSAKAAGNIIPKNESLLPRLISSGSGIAHNPGASSYHVQYSDGSFHSSISVNIPIIDFAHCL